MSRIFLAARFDRYPEMQGYAQQLEADGHQVTSRWIAGPQDDEPTVSPVYDEHGFTNAFMPLGGQKAANDLDDLMKANVIVLFTDHPEEPQVRGGRHVEFGFALAINVAANFMAGGMGVPIEALLSVGFIPKRTLVVGYRETIYTCLEGVEFFHTWEYARDALKPQPNLVVARPKLQVAHDLSQVEHGQELQSGLVLARH